MGDFRWQTASTEGVWGRGGRESLDIGNLCPFPQSLTVIVKIQIALGSRVPLGCHLDWLSKGYKMTLGYKSK